ncbi:MAG: hypothetical protein N3F63_03275 [Thermoplasmata archaeon]|nr:hypothetical protein [Thermoplasmata archaeon]
MPEMKHKLEEKEKCQIEGCKNTAERSVSAAKLSKVYSKMGERKGSVRICREHYRKFKKETKEERELERLGW